MSKVIESQVICRQPGRYIGWPTVARSPQGTLYAVFSGDRDAHVCPFGKSWLVRSDDDGRTWTPPALVNDTPLDDRDTGLCVCPDGTLVITWFTSHYSIYDRVWQGYIGSKPEYRQHTWESWKQKVDAVTEADVQRWAPSYCTPASRRWDGTRWMGYWTRRSRDGGRTWDEPTLSPVSAPHGAAVMANGDLIYVGLLGHDREDGLDNIKAARSADQGRTWSLLAGIDSYPAYQGGVKDGFCRLVEPHVAVTRSGKLVAMARYEETRDPARPTRSRLWQFDSFDNGRTWSAPRATELTGKPPHLCALRDGRLLATYGYRDAPYGQRACVSRDEGRTWDYDREIILRDDAPNGDLGYPSTVECGDGTLVSVYYQKASPAEKTCLMLTRFTLE